MAGIMDKRVCQPSKQPSSPPPAGLSHTGDEVKEHYDSESHKKRSDGRDMTPVTNYVHSVKKDTGGTTCDCIIDGVLVGDIIRFESGAKGRCIYHEGSQCTVFLTFDNSNHRIEENEKVENMGKTCIIAEAELKEIVDKIPHGQRGVVSLGPPRQRPTKANRSTQPTTQQANRPSSNDDESISEMMRQPETRPISQDQLVAETKGIYAGLVMVETKCIEVDNAQSSNTDANSKLDDVQWQALIALHRTLLHEHHDFFLASQHPSASPALRRLASKYAMPARMWRHGIHSFLELLRHRLPASREHMLTFLILAYQMMALLYETVTAYEDTWIECLGDISRYRMAIEDDDIQIREQWTGVGRRWYSKASDKSPTTGRLYHHLAILARPNALQQLYYYNKSLCVPIPFSSARESIMTLFDPVLNNNTARLAPVDAAFVRAHGILFSGKSRDQLQESTDSFIDSLDGHIGRITKRWLESGYYIAIALSCSLLGYGVESNVLMRAMSKKPEETDVAMDGNTIAEATPDETFKLALDFATRTISRVLYRWGDTNTLPFVHSILVFMNHMTQYPAAISHLEEAYPWKLTSIMLNTLLLSCEPGYEIRGHFRLPEKDQLPHPLPEDFAMRGLLYAEDYFPNDWFSNDKIDEDEKYFELPSVTEVRKDRILSLGYNIASSGNWLLWNRETRQFEVPEKYDVKISLDSRQDGNIEI
ncbi:Telomerase-binding protein EST1A [Fusarium oxysporum f. sp. rapae]|uniref:Telomerase-binding protein EST1A n=1 Tax=Fusarium oxysporum f. sp. rapae TaxID=485398 RepID=A0A8J5NDG6_FUSOX|nr:Telomerase-binding protein EST1A [Fusarium oxysporum f. sp. rapae]